MKSSCFGVAVLLYVALNHRGVDKSRVAGNLSGCDERFYLTDKLGNELEYYISLNGQI